MAPQLDKTGTEQETNEVFLVSISPGSTREECRRFLLARKGNVDKARQMLHNYLKWRASHLDAKSATLDPWSSHCLDSTCTSPTASNPSATTASTTSGRTNSKSTSAKKKSLPQILYLDQGQGPPYAKDQTRVLHMLPAILDPPRSPPEDYSLHMAAYFDNNLSRNSMEKLTVLLDVRPGNGWPNPSPLKFIAYIKCIGRLMNDHFPERLNRCIVFPIPKPFMALWKVVKKFIDPDTRSKIMLVTRTGINDDMTSVGEIVEHIDPETLHLLEGNRRALFIGSK